MQGVKCLLFLAFALLRVDLAWTYQVASTKTVATTASSVRTTTLCQDASTIPSATAAAAAAAAANTRRAFLVQTVTVASTVGLSVVISPPSALAATDIKVTPVAHTFITSSGTAKPIRENDATRFFTNARVVYLLEGATASNINLARDVFELTIQRKAEEGPGVTKGKVELLPLKENDSSSLSSIVNTVTQFVQNMSGAGDVVLVGPLPSKGTVQDGKLLADTAAALGTFVGGKREGGVISVLLDGPRHGLQLEEGGYPISDLLWYSLPAKP
jgi:hypothetical protein